MEMALNGRSRLGLVLVGLVLLGLSVTLAITAGAATARQKHDRVFVVNNCRHNLDSKPKHIDLDCYSNVAEELKSMGWRRFDSGNARGKGKLRYRTSTGGFATAQVKVRLRRLKRCGRSDKLVYRRMIVKFTGPPPSGLPQRDKIGGLKCG